MNMRLDETSVVGSSSEGTAPNRPAVVRNNNFETIELVNTLALASLMIGMTVVGIYILATTGAPNVIFAGSGLGLRTFVGVSFTFSGILSLATVVLELQDRVEDFKEAHFRQETIRHQALREERRFYDSLQVSLQDLFFELKRV